MSELTHIDGQGHVRMVDVTEKKTSPRTAVAQAVVHMRPKTFRQIVAGTVAKGNVLETARIAGVMGAKKTADLIPMCHPLTKPAARFASKAPPASSTRPGSKWKR